ncbi:MAG: cytochrome c3 family protein [Terriglobales bacterium]
MAWFEQHRANCPLARLAGSPAITIVLLVAVGFGLLALAPKLGSTHLPGNQIGYEPTQPIAFSHRLHAGELQVQCLYCHSGAERSRHAGIPAANVCMNCHRFVSAPMGAVRAEDEQAKKESRASRLIVSTEIQKLYTAVGFDPAAKSPTGNRQSAIPSTSDHQPSTPIAWVKIHNVPDFVYFDHRPHVNAGVACQSCHGPVETMERVRQVQDLSMGWCVNCHRGVDRAGLDGKGDFTSAPAPAAVGMKPVIRRVYASTDCQTCHY